MKVNKVFNELMYRLLSVLPECGFGHKVKSAYYWNQQLTRMIRSLNEIPVGHNVKFSYSFRAYLEIFLIADSSVVLSLHISA